MVVREACQVVVCRTLLDSRARQRRGGEQRRDTGQRQQAERAAARELRRQLERRGAAQQRGEREQTCAHHSGAIGLSSELRPGRATRTGRVAKIGFM